MPLVAWIYSDKHKSELEGQNSSVYDHWSELVCNDPNPVKNKLVVDLRASMLDCGEGERSKYKKYFLGSRPIKVRTIEKYRKRRQESVKVVWFVQNRVQDIAAFNVLLRKESDNHFFVNESVGYLKRDLIVPSLPVHQKYVLCIFVADSLGKVNEDLNDCTTFYNGPSNIEFNADAAESSPGAQVIKSIRSSADAMRNAKCIHFYSLIYIILFFVVVF